MDKSPQPYLVESLPRRVQVIITGKWGTHFGMRCSKTYGCYGQVSTNFWTYSVTFTLYERKKGFTDTFGMAVDGCSCNEVEHFWNFSLHKSFFFWLLLKPASCKFFFDTPNMCIWCKLVTRWQEISCSWNIPISFSWFFCFHVETMSD